MAEQIRRLGEDEIKRAIAHYLSRHGSLEFDARDVFLTFRTSARFDPHGEHEATALARQPRPRSIKETE